MRTIVQLVLGVVLAGASPGVQAATATAHGETLQIQMIGGSLANYPAFLASKTGLCEKHNFHCEMKSINSAPLAFQALVGGSIDIALGGPELVGTSHEAGSDLIIISTLRQDSPFSVSVRADLDMPHKAQGFPAIMQDFKGRKVGVGGRGTPPELQFNAMLAAAGLGAGDVTYVGVGGPPTAYPALTVGKTIDALILFEPIPTLCKVNKQCETVIDMTKGQGPEPLRIMNGAAIALVARRADVEKNPDLYRAFNAASGEAVAWAKDPAHFDEVVSLYSKVISFGGAANEDALRREFIRVELDSSSPKMETSRPALQAIMDFQLANKVLKSRIDIADILWSEAP
jgi:NitT/TauT family transport system substrate-binding protein